VSTCSLTIPGATLEEKALVVLPYIEDYRGDLPAGPELAIAEHESVNFTRFNGISVKACGSVSQARGLWQVMESCAPSYGLTPSSSCDLDESTRKVMAAHRKSAATIYELVPEAKNDLQLFAYLLYVSHNAGAGGMTTVINRAIAKSGHPVTIEALRPVAAAYVGSTAREPGYYSVSLRALQWEVWARQVQPILDRSSAWVAPLAVTSLALIGLALGTLAYLEHTGSRSKWVHWSPA
jgi:hypothetical protein